MVVRDPRVARCSFSRSWRRDDDGVTNEVLLLASGVPVPTCRVSIPALWYINLHVLDLHVWMVHGEEFMGDGSFSHDISADESILGGHRCGEGTEEYQCWFEREFPSCGCPSPEREQLAEEGG